MRKYLILLVVFAMVLGLSGMAMAAAGDPSVPPGTGITDTVTVNATVAKYCSLTVTAPGPLAFTGNEGPNTPVSAANGTIVTDCNCGITKTATVTQPLTLGNDYTNAAAPRLLTAVDIGGVYSAYTNVAGGASVQATKAYSGSSDTESLSVSGKLGANISSQPAGAYSGVITVTVTSP